MIKDCIIGLLAGYIIVHLPFFQFNGIADFLYTAVCFGFIIDWFIFLIEAWYQEKKESRQQWSVLFTERGRTIQTSGRDPIPFAQKYIDDMTEAIMPLPRKDAALAAFAAEEIAKGIRMTYTPEQEELEKQLLKNYAVDKAFEIYCGDYAQARKAWRRFFLDGGRS